MNLLVGATGFIGGHLVEYLFQEGEISKGVFRMGSHLKIMDANGVMGIEADLLDHHSLHEAMEGVDVVYNLASPMPGEDSDFRKINAEGMLNLLEVATEAKAKTFVHLSTLDVFGFSAGTVSLSSPLNPGSEYQVSKAESERLLSEFSKRNSQPTVAVVRSAKAVGARDGTVVVPILRMLESGKVVVPPSGKMSFSDPRDVAQALFKASAGKSPTGAIYLVKSFDCTPEELALGIGKELGTKAPVKKQGLLSGSQFSDYTTGQLKAGLRIEEQQNWKELGYEPKHDLNSTAKGIAEWYRKEPWAVEAE